MEKIKLKVEKIASPVRIDKYLSDKFTNYSREFIKLLCKNQLVKINGQYAEPDFRIKENDEIEISFPHRDEYVVGEVEKLSIIYEDEDILVINKPPFLKVHPSKNFDPEITLIDLLSKKIPQKPDFVWPLNRPYLVHRLDKETSGVLIVAKNPQAQYQISKQFKQRQIKKVYRCMVFGEIKDKEGEIIAPIKKEKHISKVASIGKQAVTRFKLLSFKNNISYLEVYPFTGRTHQIRAHLSFIGYPLLGDLMYHGVSKIENIKIPRVMLHAYSIEFIHPGRQTWQKYIAEYPEDFKFLLSYFSLES
ncbi:MAG: RluA family pseudouridine synthase [Endomicrobiia bacterium]